MKKDKSIYLDFIIDKEPDGVDFVINSRPLTKDEEVAISEYIRTYKAKKTKRNTPAKVVTKTPASKKVVKQE